MPLQLDSFSKYNCIEKSNWLHLYIIPNSSGQECNFIKWFVKNMLNLKDSARKKRLSRKYLPELKYNESVIHNLMTSVR